MRIATWNINGLRARIDFLLLWLRERQPDVVGLQELKLTNEQFPTDVFESEGYTVAMHGQKAWNGVAVLSRKPATVTQRGLPGQEDFGSRLLTTEIEGLSFMTVYCPNGKDLDHEDYRRKLTWFDALAAMTRDAAKTWGMEDLGVLRVGSTADLVVWHGDPLEVTTWAEHVLINGEPVPMRSRQTRLYERYKDLKAPYGYN